MSEPEPDAAREMRIHMEISVDAYGPEEEARAGMTTLRTSSASRFVRGAPPCVPPRHSSSGSVLPSWGWQRKLSATMRCLSSCVCDVAGRSPSRLPSSKWLRWMRRRQRRWQIGGTGSRVAASCERVLGEQAAYPGPRRWRRGVGRWSCSGDALGDVGSSRAGRGTSVPCERCRPPAALHSHVVSPASRQHCTTVLPWRWCRHILRANVVPTKSEPSAEPSHEAVQPTLATGWSGRRLLPW